MVLQTGQREVELGLLLLVLALVCLVSYWVYRDAEARGMDDAAYWGAAVGVAFVVGVVVGGLVAVAVYRSARPAGYEGQQTPFGALAGDGDRSGQDPAHADLPPVPELTASRVEAASVTTLRAYARRYDELNAAADPERLRAALRELVEEGNADELGPTLANATNDPAAGASGDTRRHVGRPELRDRGRSDEDAGDSTVAEPADDSTATESDSASTTTESAGDSTTTEADGDPAFDWVES